MIGPNIVVSSVWFESVMFKEQHETEYQLSVDHIQFQVKQQTHSFIL